MDASYKHPVVAVVGPTATGKTALGVALAEQFGGEVISADSMQIYKGLDVGTAKVTPEETHGIPHHGVDILEPDAPFSVADFTAMAGRLEQEIAGRGHLPILVGGTGLYVQSFLYGVRFTEEKAPAGLREQLAEELAQKGGAALYAELQQVDPEAAAVIHPNNQVRVLEHYRATGKKLSEQKAASLPPERPYRSLILGLDFPDRAALYRRIDLRVDKMLDAGLLAEAELVWNNRSRFRTAAQAIGYLAELLQEVVLHLVGLGQLRPQGKGEIITDLPLHLVVVSQDLRASALHLSHRVGYHSLVAHHTQSILVHRDSIGRGV